MRDYLLEGTDRGRTTPKSSRIGFSANVAFSREDPQRHHGLFLGSLGFCEVGRSTSGDPHEIGGYNLQRGVGAS
jgi:hypothetical protein